jgi:hypothetical protein
VSCFDERGGYVITFPDGGWGGRRSRSLEIVGESGSIDGTCWVEVEDGMSWRTCWFREVWKKLSRDR